MKLAVVKTELLKRLETFATNNGFKIVKKDFALRKVTDSHTAVISFDHNYWQDEIHLFPYVEIKNHIIHDICNKNDFHLNYTAFLNLFILQKIINKEWTKDTRWQMQYKRKDRFILYSIHDIDSVVQALDELLPLALDYEKKYSSLNAIDTLYNTEPTYEYNPYCSGRDVYCIIGLIAARLVNNPQYSALQMTYSNIVDNEDFLPETKEAFNRIRLFLGNVDIASVSNN